MATKAAIHAAAVTQAKAYYGAPANRHLITSPFEQLKWSVVDDYEADSEATSAVEVERDCAANLPPGSQLILADPKGNGGRYMPPPGWRVLIVEGMAPNQETWIANFWYNINTGQLFSTTACTGQIGGGSWAGSAGWLIALGALGLWYIYRRK